MRARSWVLVFVLAGVVALTSCGGDDEQGGGEGGGGGTESVELTAQDFSFDPTTIEVDPGAEVEVTLTNEDEAEHSFTVEELDVEVEAHGGESATTTFTAPDSGSVEFICKYHPDQMTGEITVR